MIKLAVRDATSVLPICEVWVVLLQQDAVLADVLEALVHPAAAASVVAAITVDELLDRVFLKSIVLTIDDSERLDGS